jgi:hypothetical protein
VCEEVKGREGEKERKRERERERERLNLCGIPGQQLTHKVECHPSLRR